MATAVHSASMRLPSLFRRENSDAARRDRQEALERSVVEGLRRFSDVLRHAAEVLEARRLARGGYERPHAFLERTKPRSEKPTDG